MKKITFTLTLEFEDKISSDEEIKEVAENIARAIRSDANTCGIAPEESETFTKDITVSSDVLGIKIVNKLGL